MQRKYFLGALAVVFMAGTVCLWIGGQDLRQSMTPLGHKENLSRFLHTSLFPVSDGRYAVFLETRDVGEQDRLAILDSTTDHVRRLDAETTATFTPSLVAASQRMRRLLADEILVAQGGILDLGSGTVRMPPWPADFEPLVVAHPYVHGRNATTGMSYRIDGSGHQTLPLRDLEPKCSFEGPILAATSRHVLVQECIVYEDAWDEIARWTIDLETGQRALFNVSIAGFVTRFIDGTAEAFVLVTDHEDGKAVVGVDPTGQPLWSATLALGPRENLNSFSARQAGWALTTLDTHSDGSATIFLHWGELESSSTHRQPIGMGSFLSGLVVRAEPVETGIIYQDGVDLFLVHPGGHWHGLPLMGIGILLSGGAGVWILFGRPLRTVASTPSHCPHCGVAVKEAGFCHVCGWRPEPAAQARALHRNQRP